jgi:hypothetical protein
MTDHIVIVTGSRDYHGPLVGQALDRELAYVCSLPNSWHEGRMVVIHGAARGADHAAVAWVHYPGKPGDWRVTHRSYPADWAAHGKAAGMMRNRKMLQEALILSQQPGSTIKCLAFPSPQSKGTRGMIKLCQAAGVETVITEVNCD